MLSKNVLHRVLENYSNFCYFYRLGCYQGLIRAFPIFSKMIYSISVLVLEEET